jgi:protein-tyrosine phosphatase
MTKILFVCLGNICRSPLAEAIFIHRIAQIGKGDLFEADSCGTSNYHIGSQPDSRTIANARSNGVRINHKARQFSITDFDSFDLILVMDKSNLRNIQSISNKPEHLKKVGLLRSYDENKKAMEVPDPYYGNESDFQEVFNILNFSIENLIRKEFNLSPRAAE